MYNVIKKYILIIHILLFTACKSETNHKEPETDQETSQSTLRVPIVKVIQAQNKRFALQIVSNGKISALRQSNLHFKATGTIEQVYVKNGSITNAGETLAVLDNRAQQISLRQAKDQFQEASVLLNEMILQFDGVDQDTTSVSPRVLETLKIKSGYQKAQTSLQQAQLNYENTFLKAPYRGTIANLQTKLYNPAPVNEPFCTLLSLDALTVETAILESELIAVKVNQTALITPIALPDKVYKGYVQEINPVVDENGLVLVKVAISHPDEYLFEGMNTRVLIERTLDNQIVVPKEAVVERSGKKVVFTYTDGLAKWKYITVAHENASEIAVANGLQIGDRVITQGNLNLGHDANVRLDVSSPLEE